ncbi:hypothetical protein GCM10023195_07820 [Actinoallomurus liliacearum]|uniref:Uncharacterized protein n=1 Tax=Actinoallomurus liliacearum TaxID=1080073 RepID=A0ABP8TCG7_9ACTN
MQVAGRSEPLVLMHHEGDRDTRGPQFAGQTDRLVEFGTAGRAGGDLLRKDPCDARGLERVELGVQGLADGRGAGIADPHVPGRFGAGRDRTGQLGPSRSHRRALADQSTDYSSYR